MRNRTRLSFFVVFVTVVLFLLFRLFCPLFIISFGLGGRSLSTDQDAVFFSFFFFFIEKGTKNKSEAQHELVGSAVRVRNGPKAYVMRCAHTMETDNRIGALIDIVP